VLGGSASALPCVAGQALDLGKLKLRILHPRAADYGGSRSTNAMSCVLQAQFGRHRVLLPGDLPMRQELELIEREHDLKSTLVIAPHHGSRTSSSPAFVGATQPDWVVYQAGYRNRFGHPAQDVVTRYEAAGTKAVRTDAAGATQWRMKADGSVKIDSMRAHHARYWFNRPGAPLPELARDDLSSEQTEPQVEPLPPF
jgi:competence protein ComEC